jgi:hypothetical protein|nr:MAG TPA: hypothetical protein [Caudoviricetes sp.]
MKRTILGTIAVVLFTSAISCFAPKVKDKRVVKLDPSIKTVNLSGEIGLDTITSIGVSQLGLKDLKIVIVSLTEKEVKENETLLGYIEDYQTYYLIKLKSGLYKDYYLTILSHELQHLKDLNSGRLKQLYYGFWFDGVVYTWNYSYWDRKFEQRAFEGKFELEMKIRYKMMNPLSGT